MVYPGSDRLVRPPLDLPRAIPASIALATGRKKVPSIRAGAKTGLMTTLITDAPTAEAILADADTDTDTDADADADDADADADRSEEHTSELQSRGHLVCRLLLEKK